MPPTAVNGGGPSWSSASTTSSAVAPSLRAGDDHLVRFRLGAVGDPDHGVAGDRVGHSYPPISGFGSWSPWPANADESTVDHDDSAASPRRRRRVCSTVPGSPADLGGDRGEERFGPLVAGQRGRCHRLVGVRVVVDLPGVEHPLAIEVAVVGPLTR